MIQVAFQMTTEDPGASSRPYLNRLARFMVWSDGFDSFDKIRTRLLMELFIHYLGIESPIHMQLAWRTGSDGLVMFSTWREKIHKRIFMATRNERIFIHPLRCPID